MKKMMILLSCILLATGLLANKGSAASGKCKVVKVDGTRMVLECNKQTRGFSKGNQIKIKSDNKRTVQEK